MEKFFDQQPPERPKNALPSRHLVNNRTTQFLRKKPVLLNYGGEIPQLSSLVILFQGFHEIRDGRATPESNFRGGIFYLRKTLVLFSISNLSLSFS